MTQVNILRDNLFALIGTMDLVINFTISTSRAIGPDYRALNVTLLHNGSRKETFTHSPSTNETENMSFKGALTISSVEYTSSGNYCFVASVTGTTTIESDCINLTVSGLFDTYF